MTAPHGIIDALEQLDQAPAPAAPWNAPELHPDPEPDVEPDVEAPARRQPGNLVECWLEGADEPFTVRVANRERIAYEKAAARHREWPHPTADNPEAGMHFAMTFCCWSAAIRAGLTSLTFAQWEDQLVDWELVKAVPADPTQ
jgi:hypothetical protein